MTTFSRTEYCDGGRVYSSVAKVEFHQGLLQCDYSCLTEAVHQCLKRRVVLVFDGCKNYNNNNNNNNFIYPQDPYH